MLKRRYQHARDEAYNREIMSTIDRYAEAGWELVSVVAWSTGIDGATLYFKRPVEVSPNESEEP